MVSGADCMIAPDVIGGDLTDRDLLYLGQLMVEAERALPGADGDSHMALTWLAAYAARETALAGKPIFQACLEDICIDGREIGTWRARIETRKTRARVIELARHGWLQQDGREIAELARIFDDKAAGPTECTRAMSNYAIARLAMMAGDQLLRANLCDIYGTAILVDIRPSAFAGLRKKVFRF